MGQTGEMQDTIRLANADFTFLQLKCRLTPFSRNLKRLVLLCEYVVVLFSEGHINSTAKKMHRKKILSI